MYSLWNKRQEKHKKEQKKLFCINLNRSPRQVKAHKMPQFKVTLNFSINRHHSPSEVEVERNGEGWQRHREGWKRRRAAFERTDKYYEDHDIIAYIKSNDAMDMVAYICCDAEVVSAEWDPEKFAIHMTVETDQTKKELMEDLRTNSLEDGEYEACGETGWILFTRDEEGNPYGGGEGSEDVWEYGLVDYRDNPIEITPA